MIRFNPDNYTNIEGKSISSCWKYNTKSLCVVKQKKMNEWNNRLETLKTTLNNLIDKISIKCCNIIT